MTAQISVADAQREVDEWINSTGAGYFGILTNLGILSEEVGEVARIVVRRYGEQSIRQGDEAGDLADELADVLWVVLCLANQTGVDLTEAFRQNLAKKTSRDVKRHRGKSAPGL